jgi:hypothetical protein
MRHWKSRTTVFIVCYLIGVLVAFIYAAIFGFARRHSPHSTHSVEEKSARCVANDYFNQPEDVLAGLKSGEVNVRREMFKRLFLRPGISTVYYDYERDLNYPERADHARLEYVRLDDSPEAEALLTFVRFEHPVALVFKKQSCGWQLVAALSSWLRFEDYPYENWLSLPETIRPGVHELLIRDSAGDSASYLRKARLLKLRQNTLEQVAEIDEETIEPASGYHGSDWNNVKRRQTSRYTFVPEKPDQLAHIQIETTDEVINFSGLAPTYTYWLETDGAWHALQRHWSARPATRVKLLGTGQEELVWNEPEGRFIKAGAR